MHKKWECLGIIPARGGSKRIPKKNISAICGKPLIYHTIKAAKESHYLTRIIVSSDDDEIIKISREYGAEIPFKRPDALASDEAKTIDVILHALDFLESKEHYVPDIVVILEPTSPLRLAEDIDAGIKTHMISDADTVVSVVKTDHCHPIKAKKLVNGFLRGYYEEETEGIPRQNLPLAYFRNGAYYSIKRDFLIMNKRLYGEHVIPFEMPEERSLDINSLQDLKIAECLMRHTENSV